MIVSCCNKIGETGGYPLSGIIKSISPLYFSVRQVTEVLSTEEPCDLAYEFGDGLLNLPEYPQEFPKSGGLYPFVVDVLTKIMETTCLFSLGRCMFSFSFSFLLIPSRLSFLANLKRHEGCLSHSFTSDYKKYFLSFYVHTPLHDWLRSEKQTWTNDLIFLRGHCIWELYTAKSGCIMNWPSTPSFQQNIRGPSTIKLLYIFATWVQEWSWGKHGKRVKHWNKYPRSFAARSWWSKIISLSSTRTVKAWPQHLVHDVVFFLLTIRVKRFGLYIVVRTFDMVVLLKGSVWKLLHIAVKKDHEHQHSGFVDATPVELYCM